METSIEYYLPGIDAKKLTDAELAAKWGQVQHIRQEELKRQAL